MYVLKLDLLGMINVSCIGENAYGHAGARNVGESRWMNRYQSTNPCTGGEDVLHSSGETLVSCYCMTSTSWTRAKGGDGAQRSGERYNPSDEAASHTSDTIITPTLDNISKHTLT